MGRKGSRELVEAILNSLQKHPKSIHEIAQETNSDWESVKKYLESLKISGLLDENKIGNKRVFGIKFFRASLRPDTYFGLPLKYSQEKLIDSLFAKIKGSWKNIKGQYPSKTQAQKVLVKTNKLCGLNIPTGWYKYGEICVKPYDPGMDYKYTEIENESKVTDCINKLVSEYSKEISTYRLRMKQYHDENKELYVTKELILTLLSSSDLSKPNKYSELVDLLYKFIYNLPENVKSKDLIEEFTGITVQLLNNKDELDLAKADIIESFSSLWSLVSLYQFKDDLKKYYSKEVLAKHLDSHIYSKRSEVIYSLRNLTERVPEEEPEDDVYTRLKNIINHGKVISEEEKEKRKEELKKKSPSDMFRKFGLD